MKLQWYLNILFFMFVLYNNYAVVAVDSACQCDVYFCHNAIY